MQCKTYSIKTISELTHIPAVTLRAWEARYGLLQPKRSENGRRIYSQADLELIHKIIHYTNNGVSVGKVKRLLMFEHGFDLPEDADSIWSAYLQQMLAAIECFDQKAMDKVFDQMLGVHALTVIADCFLSPLFKFLGNRWVSKYANSVAEEHFFSTYIRHKLGAIYQQNVVKTAGQRVLMACLPEEQHELPLLLLAIFLSGEGIEPVFLGANMPINVAVAIESRADVAGIIFAGRLSDKHIPELRDELKRAKVPVFLLAYQEKTPNLSRLTVLGQDHASNLKKIKSSLRGSV